VNPRGSFAILAILGSTLASLAAPVPGLGQTGEPPPDPNVQVVRAATARYRDRTVAEEEGYRRIGPDIPAMGEHWVQVGRLLDPAVDLERPEILTYVPVDGRPRLVGVAWAVALREAEAPPRVPGLPAVWHGHAGPVEEELLQVGHAGHGPDAEGGTGSRVEVIHAWVWAPSPAGTYSAENWALPALRLGLPPEHERDDEAARALSLAGGGHAFISRQVALLAALDREASERADGILARAGAEADAVLAANPAVLGIRDRMRLAAIWREAREELSATAGPEGAAMVHAIFGEGTAPKSADLSARVTCDHAVRGGVIGGLAGAGLGIVVMSNANARAMTIVSTPLAMLGAGLGALIGGSQRTDCD
jgi:hypothetical protein